MRKNAFLLALVLTFAFTLSGCSSNLNATFAKKLSADEAKAKAETYINENLMANGSKATIDKVVEENGLYKMSVNVGGGQIIDSYMTKDGSKLFPQALELKAPEKAATDTTSNTNTAPTEVPKNAKPVVELFVMSHCPYGTQIEKGIIPVVEALGSKIDFKLKFCDYSMHGDKELKEELRDRFGELPEPVKKLMEVLEIRILAKNVRVRSIEMKGNYAIISHNSKTIKIEIEDSEKIFVQVKKKILEI